MTDPEALYLQLGALIAEMPELGGTRPITPEINRWLGRAHYLVSAVGGVDAMIDSAGLTVASDGLAMPLLREQNAQQIRAIVYRALARAEAQAPAAARGGFVGPGAALDALQVVSKVLAGATRDVLIVDPYMDATVVTDFAPMAPATAAVRLLADSANTKPAALLPAVSRWGQQFPGRPLEARLAQARALHDRLILIDGAQVWSLTQSLKDFASRSPALVQKIDPTIAPKKVDFYEPVWTSATRVA